MRMKDLHRIYPKKKKKTQMIDPLKLAILTITPPFLFPHVNESDQPPGAWRQSKLPRSKWAHLFPGSLRVLHVHSDLTLAGTVGVHGECCWPQYPVPNRLDPCRGGGTPVRDGNGPRERREQTHTWLFLGALCRSAGLDAVPVIRKLLVQFPGLAEWCHC